MQGLLQKAYAAERAPGLRPMTLLELAWVGVPGAILGTIYLLTLGRRLLPDRKELMEQLGESRREYLAEMLVQPGCRLIGKSVEEAGRRQLPGLFLIEIDRAGRATARSPPTTAPATRSTRSSSTACSRRRTTSWARRSRCSAWTPA
jgi:hypothetical protein